MRSDAFERTSSILLVGAFEGTQLANEPLKGREMNPLVGAQELLVAAQNSGLRRCTCVSSGRGLGGICYDKLKRSLKRSTTTTKRSSSIAMTGLASSWGVPP